MNHLDDTQLLDALDGHSPAFGDHVRVCADCRGRLEEMQAVWHTVRSDAVPEPSPLFWDHFAARVTHAIDERPAARLAGGGWVPHVLAWSGVLALVLAVVSIIVAPKRPAVPPGSVDQQVAAAPIVADAESDEAWAVIAGLAEDLDYEAARDAGVAPRPGSVERAAMELNDAERAELARLIDAELKRIGP